MSRVCQICGRGSKSGHKVSHSNIKTLRKFMINLQVKKINGEWKRICTKCLKSLTKVK